MTYPEIYWLFLKHSKETFCTKKSKNVQPGGCLKVQKKMQKDQIWQNKMVFTIKNVNGKKIYILAKDVIPERKFEIKAK